MDYDFLDPIAFDAISKTLTDSVYGSSFDGFDSVVATPTRENFLSTFCGNEVIRKRVLEYMMFTKGNSYVRAIVIPILSAFNAAPPKEIVDALVYLTAAELCNDILSFKPVNHKKISAVSDFIEKCVCEYSHEKKSDVVDIKILKWVYVTSIYYFGPDRSVNYDNTATNKKVLDRIVKFDFCDVITMLDKYVTPMKAVAIEDESECCCF